MSLARSAGDTALPDSVPGSEMYATSGVGPLVVDVHGVEQQEGRRFVPAQPQSERRERGGRLDRFDPAAEHSGLGARVIEIAEADDDRHPRGIRAETAVFGGGGGIGLGHRVADGLVDVERKIVQAHVEFTRLADGIRDGDLGVDEVVSAVDVTGDIDLLIRELDLVPEDYAHRCATPITIWLP